MQQSVKDKRSSLISLICQALSDEHSIPLAKLDSAVEILCKK